MVSNYGMDQVLNSKYGFGNDCALHFYYYAYQYDLMRLELF